MIHPVNFGRIQKALHVLAQPKDRGAALGGIAPDAFKNARTVVQHVRHDMHAGIVPFYELAVAPDCVANSGRGHIFGFTAG